FILNRAPNQRIISGFSHVVRPLRRLRTSPHTSPTRASTQVVGLGNPGMERTRHSVGMAVISALADHLGVANRWGGDRSVCGDVIMTEVHGSPLVLLRPRRMMNINGVCVAKAAAKYGIKPENILLVHDELDKPLGKMSIKQGGSARGHNGVRSCVECLQTDVMPRLRVGIGRPAGRTSVERHVLTGFSSEEQNIVNCVLVQSVELLLLQLEHPKAQQNSSCSPAKGRRTKRNGQHAVTQDELLSNQIVTELLCE
uniref:peptidyl-tRNA hydrolase n=1 Tax=Gouania willdenowi TaxID=441366 RepID=A0A8C5DZ85_GOUWI